MSDVERSSRYCRQLEKLLGERPFLARVFEALEIELSRREVTGLQEFKNSLGESIEILRSSLVRRQYRSMILFSRASGGLILLRGARVTDLGIHFHGASTVDRLFA